jgi:hypothetical protein
LVVVGPDGSHIPLLTGLSISGGELALPPIAIKPHWFTLANRGTVTVLLLDDETYPELQEAQQHEPPVLARFFLRLAPAAEQLHAVAAGRLFEGAQVSLAANRLVRLQVGRTLPGGCIQIAELWWLNSHIRGRLTGCRLHLSYHRTALSADRTLCV